MNGRDPFKRPDPIASSPEILALTSLLFYSLVIPGVTDISETIENIISILEFDKAELVVSYPPLISKINNAVWLNELFPGLIHPDIKEKIFPRNALGSVFTSLLEYSQLTSNPENVLLLRAAVLQLTADLVNDSIDILAEKVLTVQYDTSTPEKKANIYRKLFLPLLQRYECYQALLNLTLSEIEKFTRSSGENSGRSLDGFDANEALRILVDLAKIRHADMRLLDGYARSIGDLREKVMRLILNCKYEDAKHLLHTCTNKSTRSLEG